MSTIPAEAQQVVLEPIEAGQVRIVVYERADGALCTYIGTVWLGCSDPVNDPSEDPYAPLTGADNPTPEDLNPAGIDVISAHAPPGTRTVELVVDDRSNRSDAHLSRDGTVWAARVGRSIPTAVRYRAANGDVILQRDVPG